jgi:hypothetical protein
MPAKRGVQPAVPKLNLIPPHIAAARRLNAAIIGTVVMVIVILAGMGAWWQSTVATVARLQADLQQKTQEADKVRELQRQAKLTRDGVAVLSNRLDILDDIRKSGPQLAGLIRQIAAWVPEGVRLTSWQFQAGAAPAMAGGMPTSPMAASPAPSAPGMPGAPMMPGAPGMGMATPTAGGGRQVNEVILTGYTLSLYRLAHFYGYLTQSPLFTNVRLDLFEWDGRPYQGGNLPPLLAQKGKPGKETGQAGLAPGRTVSPTGGETPGMTPAMPGAPGAPMGAAGMGGHGASPAPMAPGGMGSHGGSPAPMPMGMPGEPGMMGMPGPGMMGTPGTPANIVRDPTAPRNAVYFVIRATLANPLPIAPKLYAGPAAGVPGATPTGGMAPGVMPPGGMAPPSGPPPAGPGAPSRPAATGAEGGREEEARGLGGRRRAVGAGEE